MVPAAYVVMETWPLTPNGKLDRNALPQPGRQDLTTAMQVTPPRNEVERLLCDIWASVLGLEQVGIDDNYFELGGDSILSIQLQTRCNQAGLSLSPAQLFQYQTIGQLAGQLATVESTLRGVEPGVGPVAPSPIQQWFFEKQFAEPHHFNQSVLLEVDAALQADALQTALEDLHRHHDGLRLNFTAKGIEYGASRPAPLKRVVLEQATEKARRDRVLQVTTQLQSGLNLERGPLVGACLFTRPGSRSNLLFLTIHHLVVDGVSWRILLEDLSACIRGQALPAKTTSFGAWTSCLPEVEVDVAYWLELLQDPPAAVAPEVDGDTKTEKPLAQPSLTLCLDQDISNALQKKTGPGLWRQDP